VGQTPSTAAVLRAVDGGRDLEGRRRIAAGGVREPV